MAKSSGRSGLVDSSASTTERRRNSAVEAIKARKNFELTCRDFRILGFAREKRIAEYDLDSDSDIKKARFVKEVSKLSKKCHTERLPGDVFRAGFKKALERNPHDPTLHLGEYACEEHVDIALDEVRKITNLRSVEIKVFNPKKQIPAQLIEERMDKVVQTLENITGYDTESLTFKDKKPHPELRNIALNLHGIREVVMGVDPLGKIEHLPITELFITNFTPVWNRFFPRMTSLKSLDVSQKFSRSDHIVVYDVDSIPAVLALPNLEKLNVSGLAVGLMEEEISLFTTWGEARSEEQARPNLRLIAQDTDLNGEQALAILANPRLKHVTLSGNDFSAYSSKVAKAIVDSGVEYADLRDTGLAKEALEELKKVARPLKLDLDNNDDISAEDKKELRKENSYISFV